MRKAFFISLPLMSVSNILNQVIAEISSEYEVVYYNIEAFRLCHLNKVKFRPYPEGRVINYKDKINGDTSYFQFADILTDTAINLMPFLIKEAEIEKPDVIFHSHLAMWGKILSQYLGKPNITFYTTFILDRRIMFSFFRKAIQDSTTTTDRVQEAINLSRKVKIFYQSLGIPNTPDVWDLYVNKGNLNLSFILRDFQPSIELLDSSYYFLGQRKISNNNSASKRYVYVSMGTVMNFDIAFFQTVISVLKDIGVESIISAGTHSSQIGSPSANISIAPFVDQGAVLKESLCFITHGGMASLHEAVYSRTPVIVIPVIPEQKISAEKVQALGIGIYIPLQNTAYDVLKKAVLELLNNRDTFVYNIERLLENAPLDSCENAALQKVNEFFEYHK